MNLLDEMVQTFEVDLRCPRCETRFGCEIGALRRSASAQCGRCDQTVAIDAGQFDYVTRTVTESMRLVAAQGGSRAQPYPSAG